jgi:hypothetical protein
VRKACSVLRFRLRRYLSHCSRFSTYCESHRPIRLGAYDLRLDKWYIKQAGKGQPEKRNADERKALAKDGQPKTRVPENIPTVGLVSVRRVGHLWGSILNNQSASQLVMVRPISLLQSRFGIWFQRGMPLNHSTFPGFRRLQRGVPILNSTDFVKKLCLMTV